MKRFIALVLSLILIVAFTLTIGCKKPETEEAPVAPAPPTEPAAPAEQPAAPAEQPAPAPGK